MQARHPSAFYGYTLLLHEKEQENQKILREMGKKVLNRRGKTSRTARKKGFRSHDPEVRRIIYSTGVYHT